MVLQRCPIDRLVNVIKIARRLDKLVLREIHFLILIWHLVVVVVVVVVILNVQVRSADHPLSTFLILLFLLERNSESTVSPWEFGPVRLSAPWKRASHEWYQGPIENVRGRLGLGGDVKVSRSHIINVG